MPDIASLTNPLVKSVVRLRDRRGRAESGTFLIEGAAELDRARSRPDLEVETVFVSDSATYTPRPNERVVTVSDPVLEKLAVRGSAARLVAVARQFDVSLKSLATAYDLVLVAESIEKPGNLGTMLRTADAVGAAVIVCDPLVDLFSPSVVRASLGCLFTVPLAAASFQETIDWTSGHTTVVGTPEADQTLFDVDLTGPVAVIIGSEHEGVSQKWKAAADVHCSIPMVGTTDSLNAATSAAIMLYEAVRQRQ